jgi:hypothetical protein
MAFLSKKLTMRTLPALGINCLETSRRTVDFCSRFRSKSLRNAFDKLAVLMIVDAVAAQDARLEPL